LLQEISLKPITLITISISPVMLIIRNSWLLIWSIIEVRTIAFTILPNPQKKTKKNTIIKYFIIQSMASSIIVLTAIWITKTRTKKAIKTILVSSLILKIAAVPLHLWFIDIIHNIKKNLATIAITWQKITPIITLIIAKSNYLLIFCVTRALISPLQQIKIKTIKKILAFSSVFNNRWIFAVMLISFKISAKFLLIYWSSIWAFILIIKKEKISSIPHQPTNQNKSWVKAFISINLAGMPPRPIFIIKWIILKLLISIKIIIISIIILSITILNLFIYTRMLSTSLKKEESKKKQKTKSLKTEISLIIMSTSTLIM